LKAGFRSENSQNPETPKKKTKQIQSPKITKYHKKKFPIGNVEKFSKIIQQKNFKRKNPQKISRNIQSSS